MLNYIRLTFILFIEGASATIAARRWARRGQRDHWYDYEERREWLVIFSNIHFLYVLVWKWFGFIFSTTLYKHDENGETTFFVFFFFGWGGGEPYQWNSLQFKKSKNRSLEIDLIYDIKSVSVGRSDYVMSIQPGCEYAPTAHTNRCQLHTNLNSKK